MPYYVSRRLAGQRVSARLDAADRCLQIFQEHHLLKSVPLKGLVGQQLSFEQFLAHMQTQARAQRRLRSLQERRQRTAAFASP